jgi:EAL domain-containing protein (putative c-di-GMP-specific phosphodiesterase class I)
VTDVHAPTGRESCCGALLDKTAGPGRLYLWLPSRHSVKELHDYLRAGGWSYQISKEDRCVLVHLDGEDVSNLFGGLSRLLTATEYEDTKALFKPGSEQLSVKDFPKIRALRRLVALGWAGWLLDMLSEQRLTSFFQPIVWADEPTKIYAHECLLRGIETDGSLIDPIYILGLARDSGMISQVDLAARKTAVREAARLNVKSNLFVNFTPTSLYDPAYYLRSTINAIEEAGIPYENVVFEVTETDKTNDVLHLMEIVDYCRGFGFRIALDDVGSGYSSLNLIHQLRPDYIKLDMHLIRGVDHDPYKATIAQKILEIAEELGIRSVAEGIETVEELRWIRTHGATFAQGYFIARPNTFPQDNPMLHFQQSFERR